MGSFAAVNQLGENTPNGFTFHSCCLVYKYRTLARIVSHFLFCRIGYFSWAAIMIRWFGSWRALICALKNTFTAASSSLDQGTFVHDLCTTGSATVLRGHRVCVEGACSAASTIGQSSDGSASKAGDSPVVPGSVSAGVKIYWNDSSCCFIKKPCSVGTSQNWKNHERTSNLVCGSL